ncbi:MAG: hypothetical protein R3F37_02700 [Candidatus Competibacteraceae bacterium]
MNCHQDAGHLELPGRWRIAHVAQETPALPLPALDYVLDGDSELRQVETELGVPPEAGHDGVLPAELHARFDALDGSAWPARRSGYRTSVSPPRSWISP